MLFDNATVPFFVLILIFIFGPYFVSRVADDPIRGQEIWGYTIAAAGIAVAVLAPVLGAIADVTGRRKWWIAGFSLLIVGGLIPLYFAIPNDSGRIGVTMVSLAIAFVGIRLATTFNNAMLPHIVSPGEVGRLSGFGTAMGNAGGLVLIIFVLGFMVSDPKSGRTLIGIAPLFGLDGAMHQGERVTALLTAAWYGLFVLPMMLFTPDTTPRANVSNPARTGIRKLAQTLAALPKRPSYFQFLIAVMFYRNGISTLYVFGGIYAASVLNISIVYVGIFGILAILFGALGALIGGWLDQRIGSKFLVQYGCIILALDCLLVVSITDKTVLFVFPVPSESIVLATYLAAGAIAGFASNIVQAASRALLVQQISPDESTEAFGLYDLASRITAFTGPMLVAMLTQVSGSQRVGITPVILLLVIGAVLLVRVNGNAGSDRAKALDSA